MRSDMRRHGEPQASVRWLLASLGPVLGYEVVALKTRKVPTITSAVRDAPKPVKVIVAGGLALLFSHLFLGRP